MANYLGSSSTYVPDLEEFNVGDYIDTILNRIDALMVKLAAAEMKIIISIHDRFGVGCFTTDQYSLMLNIIMPTTQAVCSDASEFYTNSTSVAAFDARMRHILEFKSPHFNNQPWGSLGQVIYAFSIQNYAQFYNKKIQKDWWCDRAKEMKPLLSNGVKISTGPSNLVTDTITRENMACSELDILGVSSYFQTEDNFEASVIKNAIVNASKTVINEQFDSNGLYGYHRRDKCINQVCGMSNNLSISWLVGDILLMPKEKYSTQFSWMTDQKAWAALTAQASNATGPV
jgi:hypothetical protein